MRITAMLMHAAKMTMTLIMAAAQRHSCSARDGHV